MVAVQRFYMDESGVHDGSPVTCTGFFFARPSIWIEWTKKWNLRKRPIKVFHAVDCANLRGEFDGWTDEKRDKYVKQLLPTIPEFHILGTVVGFDNKALERAMRNFPSLSETIVNPYEACFQIGLMEVFRTLDRLGIEDRVAIIHEDNDCKGELLTCFDWISNYGLNKGRRMSLTFAGKDEATPLQAADALAYEGNKRIRNIHGRERRAWRALNPSRRRVGLHYFNQEAIEKWAQRIEVEGVQLR